MAITIPPLAPPYSPEVAEELSRLMGISEREPLLLFKTFARHLPLSRAWGTLGAHNLSRGALPVRDRELIILRTCYLNGCEYEWGVHVTIYAKAAGFSEEQWLATARPSFEAMSWSAHDREVLQFADALHANARASDELIGRLREQWDDACMLEACEVAGFYHGVAYMANVAGVALEEWGARFPTE